jgi:hypothetical protein
MASPGARAGDVLDRTTQIRALIESFIECRLHIRLMWGAFSTLWPPNGDDTTVTPYDENFFDELADRLHDSDFDVPPDPCLRHPEDLRTWLASNYPAYLAGTWISDDCNAAS